MSTEHDGMILTGENWNAWRKHCASATFSTTYPTWTGMGSNCQDHFVACCIFQNL